MNQEIIEEIAIRFGYHYSKSFNGVLMFPKERVKNLIFHIAYLENKKRNIMKNKKVRVYATHEQLEDGFQYEGKLIGICTKEMSVIVECDDGRLTAPFVTLCKIMKE